MPGAFTGRADDLAELNARAVAAGAGRPGLVLLSGPAGMGRTSLLKEFLAGPACREATALHAVSGGSADATAYAGVRALLRPLGLPEAEEQQHPLLRGSARHARPALRPGAVGDLPFTAACAYPVLHGLYRLVVHLTAERPVVLVLDDAQACDEHTLRWLDFLLRRVGELPLLVVLAHRTEAEPVAAEAWADLGAQQSAAPLALGPLSEAEIGEMARQVFPGPVAPAFIERVVAVAGGNPRTATHLLRELRRDGVSPDAEGALRVAGISGLLTARSVPQLLDTRAPWVRDVAAAIAVLGEDSLVHLAALAGVSTVLVEDALVVLRHAEVVAPDRVDLVHEAVRGAVLEAVGERRLAELHTRAALLLSDAGRPAEEVARHLLLPGTPEPWMVTLLRDAADLADGCGAPERAVRYLRRVLEAEPGDVAARLRLALSLAETDPGAALALLRDALDTATDVRTRARFAVQYALTCLSVQRTSEALRVLDEALDTLWATRRPGPDPALRELTTRLESARLLVECAHSGAAAAPVRARLARLPATWTDPAMRLDGEALAALLSALDGRSLRRTLEHARQVTRSAGAAATSRPLITSALALSLADRTQEALGALDRVLVHGGEDGPCWTRALALSHRALVLRGVGAIPDALADARAGVAALPEEGSDAPSSPMPHLALASVLTERGELERAEGLLERIEPPAPDGASLEYHLYLTARARLRWAAGDGSTALRLLLDSGSAQAEAGLANPVFAPWWAGASRILAVLNRVEEARETAAHGSELARRWGSARALGIAALAHGAITPGRAGVDLLAEAVELLAASPARADHARAELVLGRALLTTGDQRGAREHLRVAADLARSCGALALARTARRRLITAGGRMREITSSRADILTDTERKVAALAAAGASNRQIATALFVTVRTVETHLTSVYRKLGVSRRVGLASALHNPATPAVRALARVP
ncbi:MULTISPECIES: helix-turn-helix transcriptional regulator [unclassified Kitasatospora]|uniref:helix-turn-helix transcriptional regulator n=1 Tax=unclassified Kitasatospora TaxID=2633591 RepID=UPI002475EA8D|nr:AAA family ATPase [Kitasatospora sp. MAP12-44]